MFENSEFSKKSSKVIDAFIASCKEFFRTIRLALSDSWDLNSVSISSWWVAMNVVLCQTK